MQPMSCIIETTTSEDVIRCEFTVKAPLSKVWDALTTVEGWSKWFSEDIESDFQVGSTMRLDFGGYGECWGIVHECKENETFAYRWHPGEDCSMDKYPLSEMTTVKFDVESVDGGTRIVLTESGFAGMPEERRFSALKLNAHGWKDELAEMEAWLEDDKTQPFSANLIKRERVYKASPEKVWEAVATAKGLESWFCKSVRGSFAPGELMYLTFDNGGNPVEGPLKVVTYLPTTEFSFQWHPGRMDGGAWDALPESQTTLVKMTVTPVEGGAHLAMVESGFENVAPDHRITALGMNREGWTWCMNAIGAYVTAN